MTQHLNVVKDEKLAVITIQREEKRNALHGPLWEALEAAARDLQSNTPRAVIIHGAGHHFCSGMDLSPDNPLIARLQPAVHKKDEGALRLLIQDLKNVFREIQSIPCPVIAAIEGACVGGGLELALACDLRVASTEAFFSLPEAKVGMIPDLGGTVRTLHSLGRVRAAELLLTGEKISAERAEQWGLLNRICDAGNALDAAAALAADIAASSPVATREILQILRHAAGREDDLALETEAGVRALTSGECIEGVTAFLEKRPPKWT